MAQNSLSKSHPSIKPFPAREPGHEGFKNRFWTKVDKNGPIHPVLKTRCWLWTSYANEHGYGRTPYGDRMMFAHKLAWFYTTNNPPVDCLLHRCDNPRCVNPEHLQEGTHADNMGDMAAKGRQGWGERNRHAKLTNEKVLAIRAKAAEGLTHSFLAQEYEVHLHTIARVINRRTWRRI